MMSYHVVTSELIKIFKCCVSAVNPQSLIRKTLQYNAHSHTLTVGSKTINVKNKNIYLVGAGKAVFCMAKETECILGNKLVKGIISVPVGSIENNLNHSNIKYLEGAKNNLPDIEAENTAKKIKELALSLGVNDILLVLISGGGSALLPLPHKSITLKEKLTLIKQLANAGADIVQLNTVRKAISDIKGGKLAIFAYPARVFTFILSDIVGDPIDLIASGPTCQNFDDLIKSIEILQKYNLYKNISDEMKSIFNMQDCTLKFPTKTVENICIGSNKMSLDAAVLIATELKYYTIKVSNTITGNIKDIAKEYLNLTSILCNLMADNNKNLTMAFKKELLETINLPFIAKDWIEDIPKYRNICLLFGGETTVEVKGPGRGGRNQQLALEFSKHLHNLKDIFQSFDISFLSAGTDGIDGPTDAAGAIGFKNLVSDAIKDNLNIDDYLYQNDSYNFYKNFKNGAFHVITGHTNTNVMDIHIIIIKQLLNCNL